MSAPPRDATIAPGRTAHAAPGRLDHSCQPPRRVTAGSAPAAPATDYGVSPTKRVFQEFAATDQPGLIFTFVWVLDDPQDRRLVDDATSAFAEHGASTYFVEIAATQAERLKRNETSLRLQEKPLLRNTAGSRAFPLDADQQYQLNTHGSFFFPERHLKIDNTALEPPVVAERIVKHFSFGSKAG